MDAIILQIQQNLESIKQTKDGLEFWSARDLMPLFGYKEWRKFSEVIKKAEIACTTSGQLKQDHFVGADKMVLTGSGAKRGIDDFLMTRFACYLVLQNGDPRKPEIALAQMYFATQTRKQELFEQREKENRRLRSRKKLKEMEDTIERTVYQRGIKLPVEFASFKDSHIKALYGGINTSGLKKKRGIPSKRALADFDSELELKAKDFALAITDHLIKQKNIQGKQPVTNEVIKQSSNTRQTLLAQGIKPENLKPEKDIKMITSKRKGEQKILKKK